MKNRIKVDDIDMLVNHFHSKLTAMRSELNKFGSYGRFVCGSGRYKNIDDEYDAAMKKLKILNVLLDDAQAVLVKSQKARKEYCAKSDN